MGTKEILRLASKHHIKPLHFISTIAVFYSEAYSKTELIKESDIADHSNSLINGYAQSKWVAEKLVIEARNRGFPVSIYRLGMVTGHSQTGVSNIDDFFCRIIGGCIQLGMVPSIDYQLNLIPIDFVSRAICEISQQRKSLGKAFHLINPQSTRIENIFQSIGSLGYSLEEVSLDQWINKLIAHPENAFYPYSFSFQSQLKKSQNLKIDYQNTLNSLAATDIVIPSIDRKLLQTYVSYFISKDFVNAA